MNHKNKNMDMIELFARHAHRAAVRRWIALFSVMVLIVTTNCLVFQAVALDHIPMCGLEEHTHGEACYVDGTLICRIPEHLHTDACYQQRPVKADDVAAEAAEDEILVEDAFELTEADDALELTEDGAEAPEAVCAEPELVVYDDAPPVTEYRVDLNGRGAASLVDVLRESGLPVAIEAVDWVAPLEEYETLVAFDGASVIVLAPFEAVELAVAAGDELWTVTLCNGQPAAAEEETGIPETDEEAPVPEAEDEVVEETEDDIETEEEIAEEAISETEDEVAEEIEDDIETEDEVAEEIEDDIETEEEIAEEAISETEDEVAEETEDDIETEDEVAEEIEDDIETEDEVAEETEADEEVNPEAEAAPEGEAVEAGDAADHDENEITEDVNDEEATDDNEDVEAAGEVIEGENTEEATEEEDTAEDQSEAEADEAVDAETSGEAAEEAAAESEDAEAAPARFEYTVDLTGIEWPLSLRQLMADAKEGAADALEVEAEDSDTAAEWRIEYDAELLQIVPEGDDYRISPIAGFDMTVVEVSADVEYALTLLGGAADDPELSAPAFPAQDFEAETDALLVSVSAPEGAFPEGTTMAVTGINDADTLESIAETVGDEATAVKAVHAVDITFRNAEGVEIEPLLPIAVRMSALSLPEVEQTPVVVHVTDDGAASVVEQDAADGEAEVTFTADAFSIYAIVLTETLETRVIADEGETYRVTASYGPEAGIPAGAALTARLMKKDDADYTARIDEATRFLSDENYLAAVLDAQLFDISITVNGEAVEPQAPVQVRIEYLSPMPFSGDAEPVLVHFADSGIETLDVTTDICEDEYSVVDFETASFSTFAFAEVNYIGALDGAGFAIVRALSNGTQIALTSTPKASPAGRLKGVWVNELKEGTLTAVTAANGTVPAEEQHITVWTFELVRDNIYYIKSDDGKYLNLTKDALTVSDNPCPFECSVKVKDYRYDGNVYLRLASNASVCVNYKPEDNLPGFKSSEPKWDDSILTLYSSVEQGLPALSDARKIASTDFRSADQVVIYQRVYNAALDTYDNYVLTGDGKLVYAYDEGDYVSYRSDAGTTWYVIEYVDENGEPNGYFDFYNTVTHKYLAPSSGGILSDEPVGVLLGGRTAGDYSTTIEGWDASQWAYYGYALDTVNRVYEPATGSASEDFSFAKIVDFEKGELHPVETVDSAAKGIRIAMYDFPNRDSMNLFNDNSGGTVIPPKTLLVQRVLGADGMPVSKTGKSFSTLYNATNYRGDANHLFLQSVYDATGYYEFSSYNNGAEYDAATGNFNVYEELMTPSYDQTGGKSSYLRGNFLPFNTLDIERPSMLTRLYQSATEWVDLDDPAFDQELYVTREAVDYYFGTVIDADFLQAKDGLDDKGDPVVYSFSGDDDLWVFLDGVLVLDIGGIHSATNGDINFHTGEVKVYSGSATYTTTTIRQCFKDAGVFPDGTPWKDELASAYFTGDTFTNYSGHTMKMIYQERGAGASTLKVRFNLPVVEKGSFAVEKQLLGTRQQKYSNVQFAYQAFLDPEDGEDIPLYPGLLLDVDGHVVDPASADEETLANAVKVTYEGDGRETPFYDDETIGANTYDHVFYLRPDEAVSFTGIPEGVKYYVQEIDVSGDYFDTVMINEANMQGEGGIGEDSSITARSSSKTIQERQRVIFENKCSDKNIRDLRITKQVLNPNPNGDPGFEFRVLLEGPGGALVPYSRGEYYLLDAKDRCCRFVNGAIVPTDVVYPDAEDIQNYTYGISGPNGTIANVPDGYTVVIAGLLADTHFRVEEVSMPEGFVMEGKLLTNCDAATVDGADGRIALGKDAKVTVQNKHYSTINVTKLWDAGDYPVTAHGDIRMALYHDGALVEGSVRTIAAPATSVTWYIELSAGETLDDYAVYEVVVSGDNVRPLMQTGAALTVGGERVTGYGEDVTTTYVFTDRTVGEETQTVNQERLNIRTRTDTITNAMPSLTLRKTTVDGSSLAGAWFQLTDESGAALEGFDALESGDDGVILSGVLLPDGVYYLVETQSPEGYNSLENRLRLTVGGNGVIDLIADVETGGTHYEDKDDDPLVWQFEIVNTGGYVLPSTGGPGTGVFTALGLMLIAAALALLLRKRGAAVN